LSFDEKKKNKGEPEKGLNNIDPYVKFDSEFSHHFTPYIHILIY